MITGLEPSAVALRGGPAVGEWGGPHMGYTHRGQEACLELGSAELGPPGLPSHKTCLSQTPDTRVTLTVTRMSVT